MAVFKTNPMSRPALHREGGLTLGIDKRAIRETVIWSDLHDPHESQSAVVVPLVPLCLTRQAAIDYCSVKPSHFDEQVRPHLRSIKAGTSLLFLREDVEQFFKKMFMAESSSSNEYEQATNVAKPKAARKWERKQAASTKGAMEHGSSTNTSTVYGFTKALTHLKTQKRG